MGQVIETETDGRLIIPAELLGDVKPKHPFVIEANGLGYTLQPAVLSLDSRVSQPEQLTPEEWLKQWRQLAADISAAWQSDKSGLEELTDMRNARGQEFASDH